MPGDRAEPRLRPACVTGGVGSESGETSRTEGTFVWTGSRCRADEVLGGAQCAGGKRLAPMLAELVPLLRKHGELVIGEDTAALLVGMSAATIDRRLASARSQLVLKGRSHTKPGSLLKSRIPMRTWADHDETTPRLRRDRPCRSRGR